MTDEERILRFAGWLRYADGTDNWICPINKRAYNRPALDMNFYFRYAVPKLKCLLSIVYNPHFVDCWSVSIDEFDSINYSKPEQAFKEALLKYLDSRSVSK